MNSGHSLPPLEPGSVAAQTIARLWRGEDLVEAYWSEDEDDGLVTVISHLVMRAEMNVAVIPSTNDDVVFLHRQLLETIPAKRMYCDQPVKSARRRWVQFSSTNQDGTVFIMSPDEHADEVRNVFALAGALAICEVVATCDGASTTFTRGETDYKRPDVPLDIALAGAVTD
jgi:hypothetical protein